MSLPIRYLEGSSTGQPFETGETRTLVVTTEALSKSSGYEGDSVIYTANVKDNIGETLPETFAVDLEMDGIVLISGQVLESAVYDSVTGDLTLTFTVPADVGAFTVQLKWAQQEI